MTFPRSAALLVAMLAVSAAGPEASGPDATNTVVYFHAGNWEAFSGTAGNGRSFCGIKTVNQPDGRGLMVRHRTGDNELVLRARKPSWSIPNDTPISVTMTFGPNNPWNLNGRGSQDVVEWTIPQDGMAEFDTRFRLGSTLVISFPGGNEAAWPVSLAGSNMVGLTFSRCMRDMAARAAPTQPFSGGAPAAQATQPVPSGPTQPFTAPAGQATPAPTAPAAQTPTPTPSSAPTPAR